jgi:NADPH-dependent ferric siderophore reductase
MRRRLLDRLHLAARIEHVELLTPRMRRITLRPSVPAVPWIAGQHVQVQVAARPGPLNRLTGLHRTYTVADYNGSTMDLCVFDHGEGPGAHWARTAEAGDEVLITRPQGGFVVQEDDPYRLFVGDETASAAFDAMLRDLPDTTTTHVVIEADSAEDALPIPHEVHWTYRHGTPAGNPGLLVDAVNALELPAHPGIAYLAGEARAIQAVRAHLIRDRGWTRQRILTKPFWTPDRTGLE